MPAPRPTTPTELRFWQRRALSAMTTWIVRPDRPFLVSAAPGSGKTRPALELARAQLANATAGAVVVACPTAPLTRQWARAAHDLGIDLAPDADSPRPPAGFHGVAVTYARIARAPVRWARSLPRRTLVIADEAHHLGEELTWGVAFARAFARSPGACARSPGACARSPEACARSPEAFAESPGAFAESPEAFAESPGAFAGSPEAIAESPRWLLLSGTPFRSDATPIPGVSYDADGVAEPDVVYGYADAVADGVCRPVSFVAYDGTLSWRSGEDVIESSFDTVLSTREAGRRYRTAISTELPEGLPRILGEADARLRAIRHGGHRDAGGLVVAADSTHARQIAKLLREATGAAPVVVLHAEQRATAKLAAFTTSTERWIVAVNMVSEGVDIPRLRVGVYATAAKTPLIFRQIVGRFVRVAPDRALEPSWLYVPADPVLRDHAATIEHELRHALRRPGERDPPAPGEPPERRSTEPASLPEFVPLSADVAPQLTLFGGPAPAARRALSAAPSAGARWAAAVPTSASGRECAEHDRPDQVTERANGRRTIPAFERRAQLRDERHRLVSEVRRRDGSSHREVNAWLNRRLGIAGVEQATLSELERSIELLVGKLSAQR